MSLYEFHTIRSFKNIGSIVKTLELFFAAMFLFRSISCSSIYFPAIVESCSFLLRRLCMILVSHRFVFFLGNLIVITLFVKSGGSKTEAGNSNDEEDYLIGQFVAPNVMVSCDVVDSEIEASDFGAEKLELRRSETEADLKMERPGNESKGRGKTMEDLSNEEFQRKVEAFIERQQRFLREESLVVVNHSSD